MSKALPQKLRGLAAELFLCRSCLGPIAEGAEAGLCGACWSGLAPLDPSRCTRCALTHGGSEDCPEPVGWARGDALWDYRGGRPPLGALLVPGIKSGEDGWRKALLRRVSSAGLPGWLHDVDALVPVPTQQWKRIWRGFDLTAEAAQRVASRVERPVLPILRKSWRALSQAGRSESQRRRLPAKAFSLSSGVSLKGLHLLLVDDVWTTGTSLLRCAKLLAKEGAEVSVFALFRAV